MLNNNVPAITSKPDRR